MHPFSNLLHLVLTLLSLASLNSAFIAANPNKDDPLSEFVYNLKVRKGVAKYVVTKPCKWLKKQSVERRISVCLGGVQYPGGGSAAEMCPITCTATSLLSNKPSLAPSLDPSPFPSVTPSSKPSIEPSSPPSSQPSPKPSNEPSTVPSFNPTSGPSFIPSLDPSNQPSVSLMPSTNPTTAPSPYPSFLTTEELQNFVDIYCGNPAGWKDHYGYVKYGPIEEWDVSKITSMQYVFYYERSCNPDIGNWDVSAVTTFNQMFYYATAFNQDITSWNVSSSEDFSWMFSRAFSFNQDISGWDISTATNLEGMLNMWNANNVQTSSFHQVLCGWVFRPGAHTYRLCQDAWCGDCNYWWY